MMQTSTAVRSAATGCGCGCGGSPRHVAGAFVRPRFFAGQLLTEDDLQALTGYITGKDRLRNRLLFGPGVVCGLEVVCDPCGGGTVTVRPGYALDCCGNDIVVGCPERVDVNALVHDLRIRSLGTDCGDPCDPDGREYGLYVRYVEEGIEPIAPYATDESCPSTDCSPSRIRETFRFLVKSTERDGRHGYDPGTRLDARLGDRNRLTDSRGSAARLGRYARPMLDAVRAAGRPVLFTGDDADRYHVGLRSLEGIAGPPPAAEVPELTEQVRRLASALARHDSYDPDGQRELQRVHELGDVDAARGVLGRAVTALESTVDDEAIWPDARRRAIARAVLAEARDRVAGGQDATAGLEKRMLAQGLPLSHALRVEFGGELRRLREWLLVRFEAGGELTDCSLRSAVTGIDVPTAPPGEAQPVSPSELGAAGTAAGGLSAALLRYVADVACASILPPCGDGCDDADVLLARVELDDCDVVRVCAADRQQWLPGGPGYAAWAPKLYEARALAERVCCEPVPPTVRAGREAAEGDGPIELSYVDGLLVGEPAPTDLDRLLALLLPPAPDGVRSGSGRPGSGQPAKDELAELRARVEALTGAVSALRDQVGRRRDAPAGPSGLDDAGEPEEPAEAAEPAGRTERTGRTDTAERTEAAERTGRAGSAATKKPTPQKATGRRPRAPRSGNRET